MTEIASPAAELTAKVRGYIKGNWIHKFELDDEGNVKWPDNQAFRMGILDGLFGSLLAGRSVLVLDEASGIYPALLERAGAQRVTACNANEDACDLMREVWSFLGVSPTAVGSRMLAFYDNEPYVDKQHGESHEFLLVLNQIWPMFGAAGGSFDAVVEACAFLVSHGVIFDWTDADWASPPPPPAYSREAFCDALAKKFDHVTVFSDWLVVATGKLEPPPSSRLPA